MVEARRDLLADDEQCAVMPSLPSVTPRLERGMIRQQQKIDAAFVCGR